MNIVRIPHIRPFISHMCERVHVILCLSTATRPYVFLFMCAVKGLKAPRIGLLHQCRSLIGWRGATALSITQCKQGCDWLLASPHWAA